MTKPLSPTDQTKLTLIRASELGARLFRQNVGLAWVGDVIEHDRQARLMVIRDPRPFKAGVEGMSDSGGFIPVKITPEMVGQTVAVYCALENKGGTGRLSDPQKGFLNAVHGYGGRAGVVRCLDDVARILRGEAGPPFR